MLNSVRRRVAIAGCESTPPDSQLLFRQKRKKKSVQIFVPAVARPSKRRSLAIPSLCEHEMARIRIAAAVLLAKLLRQRARKSVLRFHGRQQIRGWRHRDVEGHTWLTRFLETSYRPVDEYADAETEFMFYFHLSWASFDSLVEDVTPALDGPRTYGAGEDYRAPRPGARVLTAQQIVACSLLILVQGWQPGIVGQHAGVAESTVRRVFLEFIVAVTAYDLPGYSNADRHRALAIALFGVDVIGSVDGSEVPCVRFDKGLPPGIHPDFYYSSYYRNFGLKCLCTISVCGLVLACHVDAISIHDSNLGFEGIPPPPEGGILLGDSAFQGLPYILAVDENGPGIVNHGIGTVRCGVENTFGRIKKTFRILRGHLEWSVPMCMAILQTIMRVYNYARFPYAQHMYDTHGL